ncbi:MAG: SIS domain-containing protein [Phycisphaerae bacterium]|nr:SIS domain-containing protein [Phycisphaerae bacterium]
MDELRQAIARRLVQSRLAVEALDAEQAALLDVVAMIGNTIAGGGAVITCGNGGSAAQAMHLAEELLGRFRSSREPIRALCLNSDPTTLTCIANDFGYEEVFARQLRALGRAGDCLVVFSTSGKSPNIRRALEEARTIGLHCAGLLGGEGGPAAPLCHAALALRGCDSAAVQEAHLMALHIICESLEPEAAALSSSRRTR